MEINDIIALVAAFLGENALLSLVLVRITKRGKLADVKDREVETSGKQNDEWQEIVTHHRNEIERLEQKVAERDAKIETMYETINTMQLQIVKMESRMDRLETLRCDKLACIDREPPFNESQK